MSSKLLFSSIVAVLLCVLCGCKSDTGARSAVVTPAPPSASTTSTTTATQATTTSTTAATATDAPAASAPATGAFPVSAGNVSTSANFDPCALLTSDDVRAVQGEAFKEAKPSRRNDAPFVITQCFYVTPSYTKSISLEVTQTDAATGADKRRARTFWEEKFARAAGEGGRDKERERKDRDEKERAGKEPGRKEEEEEESAPARRVDSIGDEAFWVSSRVSGTLYVLKNDRFIRLSLGGADDDATRQKKMKALAQKVLARL